MNLKHLSTDSFDYALPQELIAQEPLQQRDTSRLLVFDRDAAEIEHSNFHGLAKYLRPGDMLVGNDSRVFPARLLGKKSETGGKVEVLLLEKLSERRWKVLAGGKRVLKGTQINILDNSGNMSSVTATITSERSGAIRDVEFNIPIQDHFSALGHTPLPPYIHKPLTDPERYQTIYSNPIGSAASPTAGLHFSPDLLLSLREIGILFETITLHIGLDTFKPVTVDDITDHTIHTEWTTLSPEKARRINQAKLAGGRIIAVGTTAVRSLETAALRSAGKSGELSTISAEDSKDTGPLACPWRPVAAFEGNTDLYIYPGYRFRVVDAMITNFHLPRSSLLMLVAAFAGRQRILEVYREAIKNRYRFYSFGDAMLII